MKNWKTWMIILFCIFTATGCGKNIKIKDSGNNKVSQTLKDQVESEKEIEEDTETNEDTTDTDSVNMDGTVDYDLTQMNSDMVYATVYQMMVEPEQYVGKTFRVRGTYYAGKDEKNGNYYHYCVIKDAMACCAQGLEFVWEDGTHAYPEEYPAEETEIEVEGTFETYREDGDTNMYCRLANADMRVEE